MVCILNIEGIGQAKKTFKQAKKDFQSEVEEAKKTFREVADPFIGKIDAGLDRRGHSNMRKSN